MVRLVSYFLFLSLGSTIILSVVIYFQAKATLTNSVFDRLQAVLFLQERGLKHWSDDQYQDTLFVANLPDIQVKAIQLLTRETAVNTPAYQSAYQYLSRRLQEIQQQKPNLQEIFLLSTRGGKVLVSSDASHEGEYRVLDSYFLHGKQKTFVQTVYPSPVTGKPTITISTPVYDDNGYVIGVLAVHLNLELMDEIVLERTGLGETGETYLVDKFNVFVSGERFGREDYPRGVHTSAIDAAVGRNSGQGLYLNYAGVPVIGVYKWVDSLEVALLAEMSQKEAFAPARQLAYTIAAIGTAVAAALSLGVLILARQIVRPILAVTETAVQISRGNLTQTAPVTTQDEVGLLARTFNQMTAQLRQLYANLEEKVQELERAETMLRQAHDELEIRVARRTAQLVMLNRASQALISTLDLDKVLVIILENLHSLLDVTACSVWLMDEENGRLVCKQSTGPNSKQLIGWQLQPNEGIVGWVVANNQSLLLSDAQQDPRHHIPIDQTIGMQTRSLLTIPLWVHGRVVGALQAVDTKPTCFTESDKRLMESLAATAAIAIENANLYQQARSDAQTKEALLREVNHRVKNNLSAIIGLLYANRRHAQLQNSQYYQAIMQDLISRVQGLATVHNMLSQAHWQSLPLDELAYQIVRSSLRALPPDKTIELEIRPSHIHVTPEQANYLALFFNELTTNTIKHALNTHNTTGKITISATQNNSLIIVTYCDNGPGFPPDVLQPKNPRYNIGLSMLKNIITQSLDGTIQIYNQTDNQTQAIQGACITIEFETHTEQSLQN
ncbi:MAG: hypothetical protein Kow0080_30360 [Candidatus Promineifilaceae bacterium]